REAWLHRKAIVRAERPLALGNSGRQAVAPAVVGIGAASRRILEQFKIVGGGWRGQLHLRVLGRVLSVEPSLVARKPAAVRCYRDPANKKSGCTAAGFCL